MEGTSSIESSEAVIGNHDDAGESRLIPLSDIRPDPDQPRKIFEEADLAAMATSIRSAGVVQLITVKPDPAFPGKFIIVDGERRWRSSQLAGKTHIPATIREVTDDNERRQKQLVANYHQRPLQPVEEAEYLEDWINQLMSQGRPQTQARETVCTALGLSNSTLSKKLSVLKYPAALRELVVSQKIKDDSALRYLAKLPQEQQQLIVSQINGELEDAPPFVFSELKKNPKQYLSSLRADGSTVSRGTQEKSAKPARPPVVVWHLDGRELGALIGLTQYRDVVKNLVWEALSKDELGAIYHQFRCWVGESSP